MAGSWRNILARPEREGKAKRIPVVEMIHGTMLGPVNRESFPSIPHSRGAEGEVNQANMRTIPTPASRIATGRLSKLSVLTGIILLATAWALPARGAKFEADGNTNPNHQAPPNMQGEVVVTFDTIPARMSFDLPGHIKMISENGIPYTNGATETYIPSEGFHEGASYESWNDEKNKYSRMWIESQNAARIVVRHRCALVKGDRICHEDKRKVAPYGPGNWTDEWYIIHPDGTYIRRVKIWSAVARQAGPHGSEYPYELEGMYLWWGQSPKNEMASDHLEDGVITLVRMDGSHETINLNPYPLKMNEYEKMRGVYGAFANANIHVINTKSEYRPWRAGRPSPGLSVSPYVPVHEQVQLVPCFPPASTRDSGYAVAGLGQMVYQDFWKVTDDSMSEVWLNGWTTSSESADELAAVANSWWNAPRMSLAEENEAELHDYDVGERAFLITVGASKEAFLNIEASAKSPVVNPMFLINNWGTEKPKLKIDGSEIDEGEDFRFGHYEGPMTVGIGVWFRLNRAICRARIRI